MFHYHWAVSCMIRKVSAEDIAIRGNGTGPEYMCPTRHFVYIFFNPVFQVSTAKNEINLFNNHVLIVAPVTFAPAGVMTPSAEFLFHWLCAGAIARFIKTGTDVLDLQSVIVAAFVKTVGHFVLLT